MNMSHTDFNAFILSHASFSDKVQPKMFRAEIPEILYLGWHQKGCAQHAPYSDAAYGHEIVFVRGIVEWQARKLHYKVFV